MKRFSICQRYKSRGNMTWYGRVSEDGEFSYMSLGTTRKTEAQEWLNGQRARQFLPEAIRESLEPKDKIIMDAIQPFLDSISASKGAESKTYLAYRYRLKAFTAWIESKGIKTFKKFDAENANGFSLFLSENYSPKSQREMMRLVQQFCEWSRKVYKLGDYHPFEAIAMPKIVKRAKEFWTPDQIDMILDKAPDREFRLFWSLMAFAGLRHAEACAFGPESVVEGAKLRIMGKGDKEAFLPISDRLKEEIERYGELSSRMFSTQRFRKSERCISTLRAAVIDAGLNADDANNHKFRHSCISNWARANVGFKQLAELARHSDPKITYNTYAHLLPSDLEKAVNKEIENK